MISLLAFALIATSFDADMSADESRKTGVAKLSAKEKTALSQWLDSRYARKEIAQMAPVKKSPPLLEENLYSGRYIRLSDKTLWEIDPTDTPITQGWITPVEIKSSPTSGNKDYPYTLTNSLTGSSVKARPAQQTPTTTPAPTKVLSN